MLLPGFRRISEILLYSTEQTLKNFSEKFTESDKKEIEKAMNELREVLNGGKRDMDELKKATGKLQAIMHKFAELMYSAPSSGEDITVE